jgi:hypothetical protein
MASKKITKVGKDLDKTIADMKKLGADYVKADGDKKADILKKLKQLTSKRDDLKKDLELAVTNAEKDIKLQIESLVKETLNEILGE